MKALKTTIAATAALILVAPASADNHAEGEAEMPRNPHMEFSGTGQGQTYVSSHGGDGGLWTETITFSQDGEAGATVNATCIGMEMGSAPDDARRVRCAMEGPNGSKGSVAYRCMPDNESGSEMSCMGRFVGSEGSVKDHVALHTATYKFASDGKAEINGSAQWIK